MLPLFSDPLWIKKFQVVAFKRITSQIMPVRVYSISNESLPYLSRSYRIPAEEDSPQNGDNGTAGDSLPKGPINLSGMYIDASAFYSVIYPIWWMLLVLETSIEMSRLRCSIRRPPRRF